MADVTRFCMTRAGNCTTVLHTCLKGLAEELPGVKDGIWVVITKPSPSLPASDFFQPDLGASRAVKT